MRSMNNRKASVKELLIQIKTKLGCGMLYQIAEGMSFSISKGFESFINFTSVQSRKHTLTDADISVWKK